MKRKILCTILTSCVLIGSVFSTGCSLPFNTNEETAETEESESIPESPYYLSEEELPENEYYIVRTATVTNTSITGKTEEIEETRYYPIYKAESTMEDTPYEASGYDPTRVVWVNDSVDEYMIPTMYAGDKLIYKSSTYIPETYALEKYFDNGYTLGVMGLTQDLSGNYRYNSEEGSHSMSLSDAAGFDALTDVETIYFAQVGDEKVTPLNVSMSGTITGLEKDGLYECDIRQGTEKIAATLTANIHYFSSAETYVFGSFSFITPVVIEINVPEYVTTGYYYLGSGGFFRYIADESVTDCTALEASAYNSTIYTYDSEGGVDGTNVGLIFDDNGFLVEGEREDDTYGSTSGYTYDEIVNLSSNESNTETEDTVVESDDTTKAEKESETETESNTNTESESETNINTETETEVNDQ